MQPFQVQITATDVPAALDLLDAVGDFLERETSLEAPIVSADLRARQIGVTTCVNAVSEAAAQQAARVALQSALAAAGIAESPSRPHERLVEAARALGAQGRERLGLGAGALWDRCRSRG